MLAHAVLPSEGRWALASAERTFTRADAFAVQLVRDLERCAAPVSIPGGSGYGSADKSRASLRASNWNPFRFPSIAVRPDGTCQRLRQAAFEFKLGFLSLWVGGVDPAFWRLSDEAFWVSLEGARREFSGGLRRPRRPDRSGPGLASSGRCQHAGDPDYTNQRSCGRASGFSPSVARGLVDLKYRSKGWEGALQAWKIHYILSEPISASLRIVISVSVGSLLPFGCHMVV